jgi:hypothetical protein
MSEILREKKARKVGLETFRKLKKYARRPPTNKPRIVRLESNRRQKKYKRKIPDVIIPSTEFKWHTGRKIGVPEPEIIESIPYDVIEELPEISTKEEEVNMPALVESIIANRKRKRANRIDPNLEGAGYKSKGQCEEEGRVPYKRGDKSYCRNAPKGEGTTKRIRAMAKAMKIKITYVENGKRRYVPTYHLLNEIESRNSSGL